MKELVFFGSGIASLLRRNPYTSFPEEFEKFLRKHDKNTLLNMFDGARGKSQLETKKEVVETNKQFLKKVRAKSKQNFRQGIEDEFTHNK